jgi:hypothetical protein
LSGYRAEVFLEPFDACDQRLQLLLDGCGQGLGGIGGGGLGAQVHVTGQSGRDGAPRQPGFGAQLAQGVVTGRYLR